MRWFYKYYYALKIKFMHSYHYRLKSKKNTLSEVLKRENKLRWLDMGSSINYNDGFMFADIYPISEAKEEIKHRYFEFNATKQFKDEELAPLGKFDFIRMQHVFEHFTIEDSQTVLKNCHRLMNDDGYLLITVPNLKVYVDRYRRNCLDVSWIFPDGLTRELKKVHLRVIISLFSLIVFYINHIFGVTTKKV